MTNKTYRFAAVAAVLLLSCLVFMAPVGADETPDTEVVISIGTADELIELAQNITNGKDNYKGILFSAVTKINLTDDIDLKGKQWTPIGLWTGNQFATNGFNFDGEDKEIRNLEYEGKGTHVSDNAECYLGFISNSSCNITIKNVTFVNSSIVGVPTEGRSGVNGVGTVIGCVHSGTVELDNVDVVGGTVTGFGKLGGLIGLVQNDADIIIRNCDVGDFENDELYITFNGAYNIGGLVGLVQNNPEITLEKNSVFYIYSLNEMCEYITYAGQEYMMWDSEADGTVLEIPFAEAYVKFTGENRVVGTANCVDGKPDLLINSASRAYNVTQVDTTGDYAEYDLINGITFTNAVIFTDGKLTALAGGDYTLQDDITIGSTIDINDYVFINLDGHDIDGRSVDGYLFNVNDGGKLFLMNFNMSESINTGSLTKTKTSTLYGNYGVKVNAGGSFQTLPTTTERKEDADIILDVRNTGVSVYGHASDFGEGTDTFVDIGTNIRIFAESCGISIYGSGYPDDEHKDECYGVAVSVSGWIECVHPEDKADDSGYAGTIGISTNRAITKGNAAINLNPTARVIAVTGNTGDSNSDDSPAIYSGGYAVWFINGAYLEGDEAISIKQGELLIYDGYFNATGNYYDPSAENNGNTEMTGAALSITNTYGAGSSGVNVSIYGGTFRSENGHAVFAGPSDANEESEGVLTRLSISKPELEEGNVAPDLSFTSASGKDVIVLKNLRTDDEETEDYEAAYVAISAGEYSTPVNDAYLGENYHVDKYDDMYDVNNMRTVTFSGAEISATEVINGGVVSEPTAPVKSGYRFGGWYTTDALTQKYDFATSVTSDITLYAKWTVKSSPKEEETPNDETPVEEPETPVTPTEPVAGEVTVETEVTDGGEVFFETQPEEGSEPVADAPVAISAVVLPEGTTGEVAFIPVSEQPAPAGKETRTKKVFEINVPTYEKGKAAVVKFTMTVAELAADGKTAAEVALWHFDEETGEWTKLVTSYTIVDGIVYFESITYDFSPFAIIYDDAPVEQPEQPVEEPETPASPAPVLGVLAALGAAVFVRRK